MIEVYKWKIFTIFQDNIKDELWVVHNIEKCFRWNVVSIIWITDKQEILLIKEYRPWINKYIYWLPWWKIENWETIEDSCKREFQEETWYTSNNFQYFHTKYPSDFFIWDWYVYIAHNIKKIPDKSKLKPDEKWKISVEILSIDQIKDFIDKDEIPNEFFCFIIYKLIKRIFEK